MRFFFVGLSLEADGGFLLRGMMGENVILRVILFSSLFFALWLTSSEAWKNEWERPISVELAGGSAFVVCRDMATLETFLVGEDKVT
jgi:hypothetical protein